MTAAERAADNSLTCAHHLSNLAMLLTGLHAHAELGYCMLQEQ